MATVRKVFRLRVLSSLRTRKVLLVVGLLLILAAIILLQPKPTLEMSQATYKAGDAIVAKVRLHQPEKAQVMVTDNNGSDAGFSAEKKTEEGETTISLTPPLHMTPGAFTLEVIDGDGTKLEQDFSWGVLAVNTNKSIYLPNEHAKLAFAVLDEKGMMVCDASVVLEIRSPSNKMQKLSTDTGTIKVNPECKVKDYTEKPDYEATYQVEGVGTYIMTLSSHTKNGSYTITDSFEVRSQVAFDIERVTATRLFPIKNYPVQLTIRAQQDFKGEIRETVPYQFITAPSEKGEAYVREEFDARSTVPYRTRTLVWTLDIKKGETVTLAYEYNPPDKSPDFFMIGPLEFDQNGMTTFSEVRRWQLANDAVPTALEQQVNISDQEYTTTSNTPVPTDNSLGMVTYDPAKYNNSQVYFEAVLGNSATTSTSGGFMGGSNQTVSMSCPAADDCKIIYYDSTHDELRFKDCDTATCSSGSIVLLDGGIGCTLTSGSACSTTSDVGLYNSLVCLTSSDCKMTYLNNTDGDVIFADCDDATCSSGTRRILDGGVGCTLTAGSACVSTRSMGYYSSLSCPSASDCKVVYHNQFFNADLLFGDCDDATCSSGTRRILDGNTGCVLTSGTACSTSADAGHTASLECLTTDDCKIAYFDNTSDDLIFGDCDDATCSTGTRRILDGNTGCTLTSGTACSTTDATGAQLSLDCPAADDCKVAYILVSSWSSSGDLLFGDCGDATCSTGTRRILDGAVGCTLTSGTACLTNISVSRPSLDCPAADDCKLSYYYESQFQTIFADCGDATCSTGTRRILDGNDSCVLTGGSGCDFDYLTGSYTNIICFTADDCKIVYQELLNGHIKFGDCGDATCSTGATSLIDGTGRGGDDAGEYNSLSCPAEDDCKIAYYKDSGGTSGGELYFKDCADITCSSGTIVLLDGGTSCTLSAGSACNTIQFIGLYPSLDCPTGNDCKVTYFNDRTDDLMFGDCDDATCSSGTRRTLDGNTGCTLTSGSACSTSTSTGHYTSLDCPTAADCKVTYYNLSGDLYFGDCDDATCSSGTRRILDGTTGCTLTSGSACSTSANVGGYTSLDCPTTGDCKVVYSAMTSSTANDLYFGDCDDATCSSGTRRILDGTTGCTLTSGSACSTIIDTGANPSLECPAADDCKVTYFNDTNDDLQFGDCDDATCSSGTRRILDGNTGCVLTSGTACSTSLATGEYSSLDCPAADDCKIVYGGGGLLFGDCDDATCSTGTRRILDGGSGCTLTSGSACKTNGAIGDYASISCPSASDCKSSVFDSTNADLRFGDCDDTTCSSGSMEIADTGEEITWAALYNGSTQVANSLISYQPSAQDTYGEYALVRKELPLTLTNADYTVRVWTSDSTNTTADLKASRLVTLQSNGGGITDTQTQIELGDNTTSTATSYEKLTSPKHFLYDANNYSGTVTRYFEATLKGSGGGITASAALSSSSTCASTVASSEVQVTGTTWDVVRSAALTLSDDTEYWVCIKTSSGTASIANAKLIIDQTDAGGLEAMQVVHEYLNTAATDADSTYTSQNGFNQISKSNFAGDNVTYRLEATMKTSAGTGYVQLYNTTDSAAITGSELSTTSTSFSRVRSSDLASALPSGAKTLDVQLKNSASNTTTTGNAWLIIDISGVAGPTDVVFTNPARSLTIGACNGAAKVFVMELQNSGTPLNPNATTVVRVSSDSTGETIYTDDTCSTVATNGDFTFSTSESSKNIYIIDNDIEGTYTLSGVRQSGDTVATGTQDYTLSDPPSSTIRGGATFRGGSTIR